MEVSQAVKLLFVYLRSQRAKAGTLRHYEHTTKVFQGFCKAQGLSQIGDITHHHIRAYWTWLDSEGYSLGGYVRDTKRLFSFLVQDELLNVNPVIKAGIPKIKEPEIKPLPDTTIEGLLKAAGEGRNPNRDRAILVLLLDTGARIGELLSIRVEQVQTETRSIPIVGKGDKPRSLFYSYRTARFLNAYLAKERMALPDVQALFTSDEGEALTYNAVRLTLERLAQRAGIPKGVSVSPHKHRHSFATQFLAGGGSPLTLQRLLGHSTLDMTKRYATIADEQLAIEHAKASPVDRLLRKG